jgi:hypothetical protein
VPDGKFDLKDFCKLMVDCGLTLDLLCNDIFQGHFGAISTLSKFKTLNAKVSILTIKGAYNSIGSFADRLAGAFANYDTGKNQILKGNYAILVQSLKNAPMQKKLNIVEPGQLPKDTDEREKIYKTLFVAVLRETIGNTWEKAVISNNSKRKPGTNHSKPDYIELTKNDSNDTSEPLISEIPKKSDSSSVFKGISNLSGEGAVQVFNALMDKMHGSSLDAYQKEIMWDLLFEGFVSTVERGYMEMYSRDDVISISQDNSTLTKHVTYELNLISDEIDYLYHLVKARKMYNGDLTDILDINTHVRAQDRRKIFEFMYNNLEIFINGKKVDDVFRYFEVDTKPRQFKNEQSGARFLDTTIVLYEILHSYEDKKVHLKVNYEQEFSPIMSHCLVQLNKLYFTVKNYTYNCALSHDTPKQWAIQVLPIVTNMSIMFNNVANNSAVGTDRGRSIVNPGWVTPGNCVLYALNYEGPLVFK